MAAMAVVFVTRCVGIVGMAIAAVPTTVLLMRPLLPLLAPIVFTLHYLLLPFYGLLGYAACLYVILAASRRVRGTRL